MRIILMGDSTMQTNYSPTYPQTGWGQMLYLFFEKDVEILNYAKNGCSTKSFIDFGIFQKALEMVNEDTYCLIQFGHNDEKISDPSRYTIPRTTYTQNIEFFINEIRKRKGIPVLLTSIYRRYFDDGIIRENVHGEYPEVMKEVALKNDVLCLDMCQITKDYLSSLGDEKSKKYFMIFDKDIYPNYQNGSYDNTHLNYEGAYLISELVCDELKKKKHPLCKWMLKA